MSTNEAPLHEFPACFTINEPIHDVNHPFSSTGINANPLLPQPHEPIQPQPQQYHAHHEDHPRPHQMPPSPYKYNLTLVEDQYRQAEEEVNNAIENQKKSIQRRNEGLRHLEEAKRLYAQAQYQMEEADVRLREANHNLANADLQMPGKWNTMYRKLVQYKEKYGHCNVSQDRSVKKKYTAQENQEKKSIARWVGNQRVYYNQYQNGYRGGKMKLHRIEALDRLGFIWDLKSAQWNMRYNELVKFKRDNGHCRATPKQYAELSKWMVAQRYLWKRRKEGKEEPHLSIERESLLLDAGFVF